MTRYAAFLRALNVGGHGVVKMEALKRAFEEMGFGGVRTLIASGNVVFEAAPGPAAHVEALARTIEAGLKERLGIETAAMVRTQRELAKLVDRDPFGDEKAGRGAKRYIAFLARRPKPGWDYPAPPDKDGMTIFSVEGREAFVLSRPINGRYGFPNNFVEDRLGVASTARNWNTVVKMAELR